MIDDTPIAELRRRYPYVFAWGTELGSDRSHTVEQARWAYLDGQPEDVLTYSDWEQLEPSTRAMVLSDRKKIARGELSIPEEYTTLTLVRPDATPYRLWWRVGRFAGARRERIERHAEAVRESHRGPGREVGW